MDVASARIAACVGLLAVVTLATFASVAGAYPASADAQVATDPDYWKQTPERRHTVYRFLYGQSPQSIPAAYDPVREAERITLTEPQRTLPTSNPKTQSLWRRIRGITVKSALSTPTGVLGTLSLGILAYDVGWRIGTGINAKFLKIGVPANGPIPASYYAPQITFRAAGERSPLWRKVPVPEDGWVWSIVSSAYSHQRSSEYRPRVENGECQLQAFTPPPGFLEASAPAAPYGCNSYPS